jgi:hypothetical protein
MHIVSAVKKSGFVQRARHLEALQLYADISKPIVCRIMYIKLATQKKYFCRLFQYSVQCLEKFLREKAVRAALYALKIDMR